LEFTIRIYLKNSLLVFLFSAVALSQPINAKKNKGAKDNNIQALSTVDLAFIDPGGSAYRWQDIIRWSGMLPDLRAGFITTKLDLANFRMPER